MGSTLPPQHDGQNPYHIPPTYFSTRQADAGGSAVPSNPAQTRRLSAQPSGQARPDSDMFKDADDEAGSGDFDFGGDLLAFDPPPPRTGPPPTGPTLLSSPYESNRSRSDQQASTPSFSNGMGTGSYSGQGMGRPEMERDRLVSSTSVSSMSSTLKGKRAPAPAALDLSPRRDQAAKRDPYSGLGYGHPTPSESLSSGPQVTRVSRDIVRRTDLH